MILNRLLRIFNNYGKIIRNLPSFNRRLLLIVIDTLSIIFAFLLSISFIDSQNIFSNANHLLITIIIAITGIIIYLIGGQYKGISRYRSETYVEKLFLTNSTLSLFLILFKHLFNIDLISLKSIFLFTVTITLLNILINLQ